MKSNELMVGDWVEYRFTGWTKKDGIYNFSQYVKISTIGKLYVRADNDRVASADGENFYPIPLTPDILEKNFGEKIDGGYFSGDEYYEIYIKEISDSIWKVDYDCVEMNGIPRQSNLVSYVHELQHFLRLCGVELEIKL